MKILVAFAILVFTFSSEAWASETYYKSLSACAANNIGTVYCAPPFGGALQNIIGTVQCGPGQCVRAISSKVGSLCDSEITSNQ